MKPTGPTTMQCPLCGFQFIHDDSNCHQGCPMHHSCNLICCPSCRYEFPESGRAISWLRRLFRRRPAAPAPPGTLSLPDLAVGEPGELVSINSPNSARRHALAVYGLVPGSRLVLHQKSPACVVRIGETELALDLPIAREIFVKRVAS